MLTNLGLAALMLTATTGIHASGMMLALSNMQKRKQRMISGSRWAGINRVSGVVLLMFFVAVLEVMLYAVTYLLIGAIEGFEKALYFSMVTFTTLGYGDVLLDERWRLLASFESANGILMFGWSTSIVIFAVQRLYFQPDKPE